MAGCMPFSEGWMVEYHAGMVQGICPGVVLPSCLSHSPSGRCIHQLCTAFQVSLLALDDTGQS